MFFFSLCCQTKKKASLTQILLPIRFPFLSFAAPCRRKAFLSFWWTDGLMFAGRRKLLPPKVTELGRAERTRGAPRHRRMVLFYQMNPRASSPFHLAPAVKLRLEKYAPNAPHIYWCFNFLPPPPGFASLPRSFPPCPLPFSSLLLNVAYPSLSAPEWKMSLRGPVRSCPFWRLELKALDGPIEWSPIERSPTNRWQKAFRVINVVQTT